MLPEPDGAIDADDRYMLLGLNVIALDVGGGTALDRYNRHRRHRFARLANIF